MAKPLWLGILDGRLANFLGSGTTPLRLKDF
jgi:hypothetical protein